jgi:hypothetical protein
MLLTTINCIDTQFKRANIIINRNACNHTNQWKVLDAPNSQIHLCETKDFAISIVHKELTYNLHGSAAALLQMTYDGKVASNTFINPALQQFDITQIDNNVLSILGFTFHNHLLQDRVQGNRTIYYDYVVPSQSMALGLVYKLLKSEQYSFVYTNNTRNEITIGMLCNLINQDIAGAVKSEDQVLLIVKYIDTAQDLVIQRISLRNSIVTPKVGEYASKYVLIPYLEHTISIDQSLVLIFNAQEKKMYICHVDNTVISAVYPVVTNPLVI